jgi:hypothetical protein
MKLRHVSLGIVLLLSFAVTGQAQLFTELDWKFSLNLRTNPPTTAINPSGGTATANILGNNNTYYFGTGPQGLYGTPTGLLSVLNGQVQIRMDRVATTLVDYLLTVTHFVDGGAFFPGTFSFSIPNAQAGSRTVVETTSIGSWVIDTYSWNQISGPISLDISAGPGNGQLFFDEVKLGVTGNLSPVPEPGVIPMAATGLFALGMFSWFRRKRNG